MYLSISERTDVKCWFEAGERVSISGPTRGAPSMKREERRGLLLSGGDVGGEGIFTVVLELN